MNMRSKSTAAVSAHTAPLKLATGKAFNWSYQLWSVQRQSTAMVFATATVNQAGGWFN